MKPELTPTESVKRTPRSAPDIVFREVQFSLRSRFIFWLLRIFVKPLVARIIKGSPEKLAKTQLQIAGMRCPDTAGLSLDYQVVGRVSGHVLGGLTDFTRPVLLWLHGGAFVLPAAAGHLIMVAKVCRELDAAGFVPDYRLAPLNRFPAALDDCETAYRALLDKGYPSSKIVLGGDSAGGNLLLALLQRIRKAGLPNPACAIPLSPVTEMGRIHGPPSRHRLMKKDPILPVSAFHRVRELYAPSWDTSDPELSPLFMDCSGLPPTFFVASSNEILLDDTLLLARRFHDAGVSMTCHIWPEVPHAFLVFELYLPEVRPVLREIAEFARQHVK